MLGVVFYAVFCINTKFISITLQGSCHKDKCLLSHKAAPEKMPVCKFFLEGVCSKQDCPYLHVKVSEKAAICQAFLSGYCPNGSDCKLRLEMSTRYFG